MEHRGASRHWYRRGRMGPPFYIRLIILLALTAALTWYSRQGRNNPFSPRQGTAIRGEGSGACIFCTRRSYRAVVQVSPPRRVTPLPSPSPRISGWDMITVAKPRQGLQVPVPEPGTWHVITPAADTTARRVPGTGIPLVTGPSAFPHDRISVRGRYLPGDSLPCALRVRCGDISVMVLYGSRYGPSGPAGHERILWKTERPADILLLAGVSPSAILEIRDRFRPRHIIVLSSQPHIRDSGAPDLPNCTVPPAGPWSLRIRGRGNNMLEINHDK